MAILSKKQMSEEDIKLNYITPAIQPTWGAILRWRPRSRMVG
jgi:hypothetical protein